MFVDGMPGEGSLEAAVLSLAEIAILIVVTGTSHREGDEQILGGVAVVFKRTVECAAEERPVESDVAGDGCLPLQVRVGHIVGGSQRVVEAVDPGTLAGAGIIGTVLLNELSRGDVVVAGSTVAKTQFQVVEPLLCAFHKRLGGDTPGQGSGGEVSPAVVLAEL